MAQNKNTMSMSALSRVNQKNFKKGGTSKSPIKKYQFGDTVTKGKVASDATKSGARSAASAATRGFAAAASKMTPAQRNAAAKKAGNAAAQRVYKSEGADVNPVLFGIQETIRPYMNMPTVKDEMDRAGKKASDRVMNLKKEKRGGSIKASAKPKMVMKKGGSMKGKKC